jgi:non-canonical purine NTP pyrophosphatase (RdgB/HAM1 family)
MKQLTFITGNATKVEHLNKYLGFSLGQMKLDVPEIQSLDLEEVAAEKAKAAFQILGSPVLVEDTALTFLALNGLPGPLVKWFLESIGNDGLTQLLLGYNDKRAVAETCFALCDEGGVKLFKGSCDGFVADSPRGDGYGWDPVFIPKGSELTWAEFPPTEQKGVSMRRLAIDKLQSYLKEHYA